MARLPTHLAERRQFWARARITFVVLRLCVLPATLTADGHAWAYTWLVTDSVAVGARDGLGFVRVHLEDAAGAQNVPWQAVALKHDKGPTAAAAAVTILCVFDESLASSASLPTPEVPS